MKFKSFYVVTRLDTLSEEEEFKPQQSQRLYISEESAVAECEIISRRFDIAQSFAVFKFTNEGQKIVYGPISGAKEI